MRFLKSIWHFILGFFVVVGGIWTCIQVWEHFPEYHHYVVAQPPPAKKKQIETGAVPEKPDGLSALWTDLKKILAGEAKFKAVPCPEGYDPYRDFPCEPPKK